MQRGYDTNFNVDVVSCWFTGLIVMGNMQRIMQNIIELPYSPQMVKMLKLKQEHLLAVIVPTLGRITSQMTNVTNQNLKV